MEQAPAPTPHRRPPALLPPSIARLGGFAALALLGALQWQRMVSDLSSGSAVLWVLVAVLAAAGIMWADRAPRWRATATLGTAFLALLAAYAASGLSLNYLKPRQWDDLVVGLSNGAEALANVQMPYQGADPWPSATLQLLGALLCVLAGLLAFWPRAERTSTNGTGMQGRGYPFFALALLLVLVAAPVVSLGGTASLEFGIALTAMTVCFLWLERLPIAPGVGIAGLLVVALLGAIPLASAANREEPWFDYKAFAEALGPDEPISFNWGHSYGDITWPRDGSEVLRVASRRPSYWKVATLDAFDGSTWVDTGPQGPGSADVEDDLAFDWADRVGWRETLRVTLRRLATPEIVGAGTTLDVEDTNQTVTPSSEPGQWRATRSFRSGDSYTVRAYVPRPSPAQLAQSSAGLDNRRAEQLKLTIPTETDAPLGLDGGSDAATEATPNEDLRRMRLRAEVRFPPFSPFQRAPTPFASFQTLVRSNDGDVALRRSPYAQSWALAKRLMRESETPYDYLAAVNRYLQDGFTYDETPEPVPPARSTLDGFLFETKSGYCQHFSGAMALLLRMGGIPARVVTGFSPGGFSERKDAWIVRDTDAHSWVEAWFDEFGWVTFDPTPAATPARSQIAAIERPPESAGDDGDDDSDDEGGGSASRSGGTRPDLLGQQSGPGGAGGGAAADGGGPAWWSIALAGLAVALLAAWALVRWRRRGRSPAQALEGAVAELEAALRRIGRPAAAGTTLQQLEQRLGRTPEAAGYLRALRAGRYGTTPSTPTPRGRRALRRELGSGSGPRGKLRALWALPPWR